MVFEKTPLTGWMKQHLLFFIAHIDYLRRSNFTFLLHCGKAREEPIWGNQLFIKSPSLRDLVGIFTLCSYSSTENNTSQDVCRCWAMKTISKITFIPAELIAAVTRSYEPVMINAEYSADSKTFLLAQEALL